MEDDEFVGCISCMGTTDLYDLFTVYEENAETYASLLETCFSIQVTSNLRHICADCADQLEKATAFKDQTQSNMAVLQNVKNEEYLDESILAEAEIAPYNHDVQEDSGSGSDDEDKEFEALDHESSSYSAHRLNENKKMPSMSQIPEDIEEDHAIQALDETTCIYCDLQLSSVEEVHDHIRSVHELEPRTGQRLRECSLCGVALRDPADHHNRCVLDQLRCHGVKSDAEGRKYACHFCDNVYVSKKACFTHLRMKHGLKLCNDQAPKYVPRERKKCHLCSRDFSQKQILNKHLMKAHGLEVEKRKAFVCPLCDGRVSYGTHFSAHLLHVHRVHEHVEQLEFHHMDDFMLFKSAIQEETKYRFRKTTASKQTIEGIRSHYMCSQSGVYVYQGKGKRPAPERQIYKTGKACPAHMIVTETTDRVLVTFYKTHVGHGTCPYFEPREPKKPKLEYRQSTSVELGQLVGLGQLGEQRHLGGLGHFDGLGELSGLTDSKPEETEVLICDTCGMLFAEIDKFRDHAATHGLELYPCQYCDEDFQNLETWSLHVRLEHNVEIVF